MNINLVIPQLRTLATIFNNNIAGAAAYANAVADQVFLPLPCAYVVPGDEEAGENGSMTGLRQEVTERIGIIVILQTLNVGGVEDITDRRAQAASAYLHTIRASIFRAVLNWRPDWSADPSTSNDNRGFRYAGGHLLDFDRGRFFYQFDFALDTLITDADGWQQSFDDLIDVQGTITNNGTPPIVFDQTLPT